MKCLIVSGGKAPSKDLILSCRPFDYVVAADKGASYLLKCGIVPNVLLGDFDSLGKRKLAMLKALGCKVFEYEKDKDFTDTEGAVRFAMDMGFKDIIILGAIGTRMDHTLANIDLLKIPYDNGVNCIIEDEKNRMFLGKSPVLLKKNNKKFFSILPYSEEITGLSIIGAKYELKDYTLIKNSTIAVSNEFLNDVVKLQFLNGIPLIIESND